MIYTKSSINVVCNIYRTVSLEEQAILFEIKSPSITSSSVLVEIRRLASTSFLDNVINILCAQISRLH